MTVATVATDEQSVRPPHIAYIVLPIESILISRTDDETRDIGTFRAVWRNRRGERLQFTVPNGMVPYFHTNTLILSSDIEVTRLSGEDTLISRPCFSFRVEFFEKDISNYLAHNEILGNQVERIAEMTQTFFLIRGAGTPKGVREVLVVANDLSSGKLPIVVRMSPWTDRVSAYPGCEVVKQTLVENRLLDMLNTIEIM
jgi:hypothetical protein